jgi:hypothetical protein
MCVDARSLSQALPFSYFAIGFAYKFYITPCTVYINNVLKADPGPAQVFFTMVVSQDVYLSPALPP